MKKNSLLSVVILAVVMAFVINGCLLHHHKRINHPSGIGYYKEGKTRFEINDLGDTGPFEVIDEDSRDAIFHDEVINIPIYVKAVSPTRVYLGFSMEHRVFELTMDTSKTFSNPYFSVKLKLKNSANSQDLKGIYYFKFEK